MVTQRPAPIDTAQLAEKMYSWCIGHTVHYYQQVESTMPLAHALASGSKEPGLDRVFERTTPSGTVIVAEEQTAGRGRRQRSWHTPYGTALLTGFLFCPPELPAQMSQLPMLGGLATVRAIAHVAPSLRPRLALKWPNDVIILRDVQNSRTQNVPNPAIDVDTEGTPDFYPDFYKVAGILAEGAFQHNQPSHGVLGIGINVNQDHTELPTVDAGAVPPISLRVATGHPVDRTALLIALCQQFSTYCDAEKVDWPVRADEIYHEWRNMLHTLGEQVTVYSTERHDATHVSGSAQDVTRDGSLVLVDAAGTRHEFAAGDVSLRSPKISQTNDGTTTGTG